MGYTLISLKPCIQGAPRTHCHPPHILQHYYTAECFRRIVLSASCNELRLMAPSIAAVSYFAIPYLVDSFSCIFFLHRIPHFSMNAEPQFLTGILLMAAHIILTHKNTPTASTTAYYYILVVVRPNTCLRPMGFDADPQRLIEFSAAHKRTIVTLCPLNNHATHVFETLN